MNEGISLESFGKLIHQELGIRYKEGIYIVSFPNVATIENGFATYSSGLGKTIEEACTNYAKEISFKSIKYGSIDYWGPTTIYGTEKSYLSLDVQNQIRVLKSLESIYNRNQPENYLGILRNMIDELGTVY